MKLSHIADLKACSLSDIQTAHLQIAASVTSDLKVLPHFERYLRQGYYPFRLETNSEESYLERVTNIVSTIIENDIPAVEPIEYETLLKAKRLLMYLAQTVPFTTNMSNLCTNISTTRNQLIRLLSLLDQAALLRLLYASGKNLKALGKPEKILFNNPNLMYALSRSVDIGTIRETFFTSMLSQGHQLQYPAQGDLLVDDTYLFEIGGKGKRFSQIRNLPDSYVAADDIEIGFGNKIPLWLFGLLY